MNDTKVVEFVNSFKSKEINPENFNKIQLNLTKDQRDGSIRTNISRNSLRSNVSKRSKTHDYNKSHMNSIYDEYKNKEQKWGNPQYLPH